ncbi:MAG: response regulator [Anaerolineae bacterium]
MSQAGRIRVLIVDDHTIVRAGVRLLLDAEADIEVVGEAADGQEAIDRAAKLQPDVVLMDIGMPGMNGLEATREIKSRWPNMQVLVLTMHRSDDYFFQVLDAGASGYVLKGAGTGDLISAVRAVDQGDVFLYPSMAKKLVADYLGRVRSGEERASYDGLTNREREVLTLVAEGLTSQEIADQLTLSVNTVQAHRRNIMGKLNLHNRSELIKYAIRHGLIQIDDD